MPCFQCHGKRIKWIKSHELYAPRFPIYAFKFKKTYIFERSMVPPISPYKVHVNVSNLDHMISDYPPLSHSLPFPSRPLTPSTLPLDWRRWLHEIENTLQQDRNQFYSIIQYLCHKNCRRIREPTINQVNGKKPRLKFSSLVLTNYTPLGLSNQCSIEFVKKLSFNTSSKHVNGKPALD